MIDITAKDAFQKYDEALREGWLRQGTWNAEEDGRRVACMLGVLDPSVDSPSDCPASVMPKFLARMVPGLFDGQSPEDAFAWGHAFYEQLARLNGDVPFTVIYDWHANYSWRMGIEAAEKRGLDPAPAKAVQALHARALLGDRADLDEWYKALRNANAYAYAYAEAYADANAYAYAYANTDADANANAYAYANTDANANANADAIAEAYADAYAYADARRKAVNILAMGLVECMKRVNP